MSPGVRLILRGMRWRLGISLLTVLTSTIAVGAALIGPLYLRAAGDSVLRTTVAAAAVQDRGLTLSTVPGQAASPRALEAVANRVAAVGSYGTPISSVVSGVSLTSRHTGLVRSNLLARSGICRRLRFVVGGCPSAPGQVAISRRSAADLRVGLGTALAGGVGGSARPLELTVAGIYAVPDVSSTYWWGGGPGDFAFGHSTNIGSSPVPEIDSLVTTAATALAVPARDAPAQTVQLPLRPDAVSLTDEPHLRVGLAQVQRVAAGAAVQATSRLGELLDAADQQRHVMATIVAVAAVELVVLAIWVLSALLVRSIDARRAEMRVARLRGFTAGGLLWAVALEPAILCLAGAILGVLAAGLAVAAARHRILDPHATITADVWTFAALGTTVGVIMMTLAWATLRRLRSPDPDEAAGTGGRRDLIVDAVLVVLSIVALIALATNGSLSGHGNPIASAAPGLLALGVAVLAVRAVLAVGRVGVSATTFSRRISLVLAVRRIVRQPRLMRQTRALIIALGLACFAVAAWSESRANRSAAATFAVGAPAVVQVTPEGVELTRAVDAIDPHGRYAMAAVLVSTPSSTTLGVDARRLPVAAAWPPGIARLTVAQAARRLRPPTRPAIELSPASVQLTVRAGASHPGALAQLELALWVVSPAMGTSIVDLGRLRAGSAIHRASAAAACPGGCRLAGFGVVPVPGTRPAPGVVRVRLSGLSVVSGVSRASSRPIGAGLFPAGWHAAAPGVTVTAGAGGALRLVVSPAALAAATGAAPGVTPPMAAPDDHPATLPGAVTRDVVDANAAASTGGTVPAQGLDGQTLAVAPAVSVFALPGLGSTGVMVDLDLLRRAQIDATTPDASDEVWLGPAAPAGIVARLGRAGLRVDRVQTAASVFARLQRSGPALADDFLLLAALAALLAAATSTLATLGANTRGRAAELMALQVAGISRRALAGSLALETGVLSLIALLGVVAGVAAALLATPALPQVSGPDLAPLRFPLPTGLIIAVAAAIAVAVGLAGAGVSAVVLRRMSPDVLRAVPDDLAA